MKILIVIDKKGTAIDRLAQAVKKYSPHLEVEILAVHPKRPDVDSLHKAVELMEWCDVIDIHYWKSGEVLRKNFAKLFDAKPKILFHFNPYDADNQEINDFYDLVVVGNEEIHSRVPYTILIPYGIDLDTFKFNEDYTEENVVNMTVSRIEGKKGVREVAQACKELGYKFKLVGRISKPGYMDEVRQVGGKSLEFYENVSDEKMLEIYRQSAIHVCNSVDGFESGCYDDKTEILTDQGWKLFKDLDKTEKVATLNTDENTLEYQKPNKYVAQDNHKELYSVDNRALSFSVTANHNMWVATKTRKGGNTDVGNGYKDYRFVRADELPSGFKIQRTCDWVALNCDAELDVSEWVSKFNINWFKFMGIYLSEGCVIKGSKDSYRISIAAVKKEARKDISQLLDLMGFKYGVRPDQFRIGRQNELAKYLLQFGKARDKYIPDCVKFGTRFQIDTFLDWYVKGDGRVFNGARIVFTSSKRMTDDLQECFIKAGTNANIKVRDRRGEKRWIIDHWIEVKHLEYTVYERRQKKESYIRRSMDLSIKKYDGKVYCVEVPKYHVLLVRKKGTAYFCGNTLPILESMITGIPVLTRSVGHVPELFDGKNLVVRNGEQNDVEDLKKNIKEMMENRDWRLKLREKAWDTARARDIRKMVREIRKLYYKAYMPNDDFSSIIIPTKDNPEAFIECLVGALSQDFKKYEIVVADSGDTPIEPIVNEARKNSNIPIKYIKFSNQGRYTLAEARNRAVIEAEGQWLLFCDDRIKMEPNVLGIFNGRKSTKIWFWGMKDNAVKGFVENFSYVNRRELIIGGMFCERISGYGGTTQEIRTRFEGKHNFTLAFIQDAQATGIRRTKSKSSRRNSIIDMKFIIFKLYD